MIYGGAIAVICIIAAVWFWNYSLQKEVARRRELEKELFYSHDQTVELQKQLIRDEREIRSEVERRAAVQYQQLVQASKLVTLGTLVSGIAHEINNPNNFIALNNSVLRKIADDLPPLLQELQSSSPDLQLGGLPIDVVIEKLPGLTTAIAEGSVRIKNTVAQLKDFARQEPAELRDDVDLITITTAAIALLQHKIDKRCRNFSTAFPAAVPLLRGHGQKLEQVIVNLIDNALDALEDADGTIALGIEQRGVQLLLTVRDTGCGIASEHNEQLFDPFFTTKRDRGGTGLGLSISFAIIKEHGGVMHFDSAVGEGTTATVELPVEAKKGEGENG